MANNVVVYTIKEMLDIGLKHVGYSKERIQRSSTESNKYRFRVHFGSDPIVLCMIWTDLQTTTIADAFVPPPKRKVKHFLMAMHLLKLYPTEIEREATFDVSPAYGRYWCWYFIKKVRALKASKIVWDDGQPDDVWILTVDGIHCWTVEYIHEIWSMDTKQYSHKYAHAGRCYELGISLSKNQVVWMNGAFKAGANDKTNFKREGGLKENLELIGKKAIGNAAYVGYPHVCSTDNPHDDKEVKKFKTRAKMRHETFNGLIKSFGSLDCRFRHSVDKFEDCFEAVVVICQYQIETTRPLFNVLLENMQPITA